MILGQQPEQPRYHIILCSLHKLSVLSTKKKSPSLSVCWHQCMIPIDMGFRSRALLSKISLCEKGNSCKIVPQEWDSRVWVGLVSARTRTFDRTRAGVLPVQHREKISHHSWGQSSSGSPKCHRKHCRPVSAENATGQQSSLRVFLSTLLVRQQLKNHQLLLLQEWGQQ